MHFPPSDSLGKLVVVLLKALALDPPHDLASYFRCSLTKQIACASLVSGRRAVWRHSEQPTALLGSAPGRHGPMLKQSLQQWWIEVFFAPVRRAWTSFYGRNLLCRRVLIP